MEWLVTQDKSKFAEDSVKSYNSPRTAYVFLPTRREQRRTSCKREADNRKLTLFMGEMCKKKILNSWFVQV